MDVSKARCRQSTLVHENCDQCGQRPEVIHKPADRRGACYCGDCCPVCHKEPVEAPEGPEANILRRLSGGAPPGKKGCPEDPAGRSRPLATVRQDSAVAGLGMAMESCLSFDQAGAYCIPRELHRVVQIEFFPYSVSVAASGFDCDSQRGGDFFAALPVSNEYKHLKLSRCEGVAFGVLRVAS